MGDVAMTVPVLRAFAKQYPQVKITVVSRPFFRPLFDKIPGLVFFPFDDKQRHKGFVGLWRLYRDLKQMHVSAYADLHNVLRSKIVRTWFRISGTPVAFFDKNRPGKKALTQLKDKTIRPLPTVFEKYAEVFEKLGFPISLSQGVTSEKPIPDETVQALLGDPNRKRVGIAPFAQYKSKVYPVDLMRQVLEGLSKQRNHTLFLFGSKQEIEVLQSLTTDLPQVVIVAGKISFAQELQLIAHLDLMLSMDSGNAHLAAISGVPTVTLWGATHPYTGFSPFNQPLSNCLTADRKQYPFLPTSIYGNKEVDGYEDAMRTISPQQVIEKIESLLS